MSMAVAVDERNPVSRSGRADVSPHVMAEVFDRLLDADRKSAEFLELWAVLDAYLAGEVERERAC